MSEPGAWLTPDDAPEMYKCWCVFCPDGEEFEAALRGALTLLSQDWNWEKLGDLTPREVADFYMESNFLTFNTWRRCMAVGTVFWFAGDAAPDHSLVCDGSTYAVADYPELFGVIGYTFGGSGANGNLPDLTRRGPVGLGSGYDLADTGGSETHTLTVAEMPSHRHKIELLTLITSILPVVGPIMLRIVGVGEQNTTYTGGGQSHENRPPYLALLPCIQAL